MPDVGGQPLPPLVRGQATELVSARLQGFDCVDYPLGCSAVGAVGVRIEAARSGERSSALFMGSPTPPRSFHAESSPSSSTLKSERYPSPEKVLSRDEFVVIQSPAFFPDRQAQASDFAVFSGRASAPLSHGRKYALFVTRRTPLRPVRDPRRWPGSPEAPPVNTFIFPFRRQLCRLVPAAERWCRTEVHG